MYKQLIKLADNSQQAASFNETVPSTDIGMQMADSQGMAQPMKQPVVDPSSDQFAAVPTGYNSNQDGTPQSAVPPEMIEAAQSFLGPEILQAALQGNPNASDILARTAAHFGSTYMNSLNQSQTAPEAQGSAVPEGAVPQSPTPGITTPEQDLASELVPDVGAMQYQNIVTPGNASFPAEPGQVAGQSSNPGVNEEYGTEQSVTPPDLSHPHVFDAQTVAKLINLARAGHI